MSFDLFSALGFKSGYWFFPWFIGFYIIWMNFFLKKNSVNRMISYSNFVFSFFFNQIRSVVSKGIYFSKFIMSSVFIILLSFKFWKFSPYKKGFSSSMVFTLSLGLVFWLVMKFSSFSFKLFQYFSHYTPVGSPIMLIFFMNLVEVMSKCIRPMTLGVRLAVNLLTGHLLVSMFSKAHSSLILNYSLVKVLMIGLFGIFMMFYESCMCVIQAFVYSLMMSQYFDEHSF